MRRLFDRPKDLAVEFCDRCGSVNMPAPRGGDSGAVARVALFRRPVPMAPLETPVACCAPLAAPVLDEEEAVATAELFKALGDPARVRIVNLLATTRGAVCVCDLNDRSGWRSRPSRTI